MSSWLVGKSSTSRVQAYRQLLSRKARCDFSSTAKWRKQAVSCIRIALPELDTVLSVQMHRYRFSNRKCYSWIIYLRSLALADRFFMIEHSVRIISSIQPLSLEEEDAPSSFGLAIPTIYCLLSANGSFLEREDSFPLEEGRTAGNYSTFLREFLRIRVGLLSTLVDSVSIKETKASRLAKRGLMMDA
jgi:hypothetical protein